MELNSIKLQNFKGIKDFGVNINGKEINIRGKNASGKTTLVDAWTWLLFDKDSSDRKDFEIKPLLSTGEEVHNLESTVEASLKLQNGGNVLLKKVFSEKWTRRRGEETETFTGHETVYWINELPVKKSEYEGFINAEIMQEASFKILSNPLYFNEQIKWQDRRKILFDTFGDVSNEDIFKAKPELSEILMDLNSYGAENLKKVIAEKKKKINKELEAIPVRIDELTKTLPDETNFEKIESAILTFGNMKKSYEEKIKTEEEEKKNIDKHIQENRSKKARMEGIQDELMQLAMKDFYKAKNRINELKSDIEYKENLVIDFKKSIESDKEFLKTFEVKRENLLKNWHTRNSIKFVLSETENFTCPTCKQNLPEGDISDQKKKMELNFNSSKSSELGQISEEGKNIKNTMEKLVEKIKLFESKTVESEELTSKLKLELEALEKFITESEAKEIRIEYEHNEEYKKLKTETDGFVNQTFDNAELEALNQKLTEIKDRLDEERTKLYSKMATDEKKKRINELGLQQKSLAQEFANIEKREFLADKFITERAALLEQKINSKFELVKFKLFEKQINGGINETCETMLNGVPFGDLNTAGKVQAGIDTIKVFMGIYDRKCPLWIDNRESITNIPAIQTQVINLIVDDSFSKINIEVK